MSLINKNIENFNQGVSQQEPSMRLETQCGELVNSFPSLVYGNMRRNPTEYVANLSTSYAADSFTHAISRDNNEEYISIITKNPISPIEVFKIDGTKCTVRYGTLDDNLNFTPTDAYKNYILLTSNPKERFSAVTVADYTIIVNKDIVVQKSGIVDNAKVNEAVVYVKKGVTDTTYSIKIDGAVVASMTATTFSGNWPTHIYPSYIANELSVAVAANGLYDVVTVDNVASSFKIKRKDGGDFSITATDSYDQLCIAAIKGITQKYTDLPAVSTNGTNVCVAGDPNQPLDDYYVEFTTVDNSTGFWKETTQSGIDNQYMNYTMPHRLVRTGVNEFTFAPINWSKRNVGDEKTAPFASFMGSTINSVFFYRSRLGFLTGENVVLSKTNDFFNLFRTTVLETLDDDPIDVSVSSTKVNILKNAIPMNNSLLVFGDQIQAVITSGNKQTLTPKTVSSDITTQFSMNNNCVPTTIGSNTYMAVNTGSYTSLKEYFLTADTINYDASDVTAHCPRYIPSNATKIVGSSIFDILFVQTATEPNNLYVYKYYWSGDTKLQSAWCKWTFDAQICSVDIIYNYLYLIINRGGIVYLEKINLDVTSDGSLDYNVYLDRKVLRTGTYNSVANTTTWLTPYYAVSGETYKVVAQSGNPILSPINVNGSYVTCKGKYDTEPYYVGTIFTRKLTLSKYVLRDKDGKNRYSEGRNTIRKFRLFYDRTGGLTFTIKIKGRPDDVVDFTNVIVGQAIVDSQVVTKGHVDIFPFSDADNLQIVIENQSTKPDILVSGSYESNYVTRSKKI